MIGRFRFSEMEIPRFLPPEAPVSPPLGSASPRPRTEFHRSLGAVCCCGREPPRSAAGHHVSSFYGTFTVPSRDKPTLDVRSDERRDIRLAQISGATWIQESDGSCFEAWIVAFKIKGPLLGRKVSQHRVTTWTSKASQTLLI